MEVDERGLWLLVELASSWLGMMNGERGSLSMGVWDETDEALWQEGPRGLYTSPETPISLALHVHLSLVVFRRGKGQGRCGT